jgi:hypothetical protein
MRIKKLPIILSMVVILLCWFSSQVDSYSSRTINSVSTVIYDMTPPHEGMPRGVPSSYDWVHGPRLSMGNNPQSYNFRAMIAWGQLYEDAIGNPATNSRVQIRNIQAYMLSKRDGKWHLLQSSKKVDGAAYREDYAGNDSKPADIRNESDGSISVKAGEGYNFHFWPATGRTSIDPNDVAGIFTTVEARLIKDNYWRRDDRSRARYLLSMGGDYWLDVTAQWSDWPSKVVADIGIGKFKYVTNKWQAFNMTTLSPSEIRRNPPPMDLAQSQSAD